MASGPPSSAYAWHPRTPASQAWQLPALSALVLGPFLACRCTALPLSAVGIQMSQPGSPHTHPCARGLWHLSQFSWAPAPGGSPGLCVWTVGHSSHGAATAGPPSLPGQWPLGFHGPRVCQCSTEAWLETVGLSHGFLTVQIEVSLLPLCVGRSHQAGGGQQEWPLLHVKPAGGPGWGSRGGRHLPPQLRTAGGRIPQSGGTERDKLARGHSYTRQERGQSSLHPDTRAPGGPCPSASTQPALLRGNQTRFSERHSRGPGSHSLLLPQKSAGRRSHGGRPAGPSGAKIPAPFLCRGPPEA